jgi:DNA-binding CsgD family transcriptional regulator
LSLFDDLPLTNAARTRKPVALYNSGDITQQFPHLVEEINIAPLASQGALVAVPLLSDLGAVGVIGMSFVEDIDPPCSIISELESVAPLLGLFVELTAPPGVSQRSRMSSVGARDNADIAPDYADEPTPGPEGLSKRQLRMLGMIEKKMSNQEIARALEYSVSTVRAEALNIYRYLGVHSRREAVEEARQRGILSRPHHR